MSLENFSSQQINELALLSKALSDNPKTRKQFLNLTKEVRPDVVIPELEIEDKVEKATRGLEEKLSKSEARLAEREAQEEVMRRRQALIEKGLVKSKDDIPEVEKIMVEKKIADHETAAEYWTWMKQAAEPTASSIMGSPVLNKFPVKDFFKNPVNAARNTAVQALNEIRKNPKVVGF